MRAYSHPARIGARCGSDSSKKSVTKLRRQPRSIVRMFALAALASACWAQPKVLLVVAHPDDELTFAATTYRLAKERGGTVDEFVITNGEGGYRYSTLAEPIYGVELTKEEVGRRELPDIRKRELLNAGKILGIRAHYFLDERDINNTNDPNDVLNGAWNTGRILSRLRDLLTAERYDFVAVMLPRPDIGGHHVAASLLALRAAAQLDEAARPVVLGASFMDDDIAALTGPETAGFSGKPAFVFDRTAKFGFNNGLSYQIVVNWMIAEHKSQGLYQNNMNRFNQECFWVFEPNQSDRRARAQELFDLVKPAGAQALQ
jgi:N-acetylglucosamine malate deacetylase 2